MRTGCDQCDWHGPEIGDTLEARSRELHRATHEIGRRIALWFAEAASRRITDREESFR